MQRVNFFFSLLALEMGRCIGRVEWILRNNLVLKVYSQILSEKYKDITQVLVYTYFIVIIHTKG